MELRTAAESQRDMLSIRHPLVLHRPTVRSGVCENVFENLAGQVDDHGSNLKGIIRSKLEITARVSGIRSIVGTTVEPGPVIGMKLDAWTCSAEPSTRACCQAQSLHFPSNTGEYFFKSGGMVNRWHQMQSYH